MSKICSELHQLFNKSVPYKFPYEKEDLPQNGIYIMFEKKEKAHGFNRIVYVGSHRGENRLVKRLDEHFINENKDRSILRKKLGELC